MLIKEVPYRGNGKKTARFYEDRVEFSGKVIPYDDIAVLTTSARTTIHTYIGIPIARSFDGGAEFKTVGGKTARINMSAVRFLGIPILFRSPRKSEKLYPVLYEALYTVVAKYLAGKLIQRIRSGETVEVAGLSINSMEARKAKEMSKKANRANETYRASRANKANKAKEPKKVVVIDKGNYRDCKIANSMIVSVYDKAGDVLWHSSIWTNKNILLIPHVLDVIFGEDDGIV